MGQDKLPRNESNTEQERFGRYLRDHQWILVAIFGGIALGFGFYGFMLLETKDTLSPISRISHAFYHSLQLFVLEYVADTGVEVDWTIHVARVLAPSVAVYTAIVALFNILYSQVQLIKLSFFIRNHVVICGLGRIGALMTVAYRNRGAMVVVIEQDADNVNIQQAKDAGAIVLIGEATDKKMLVRAKVHYAKLLYAVSGDDGINAEIAINAREVKENRRGEVLTCYVHTVDLQHFDLFNENEIMKTKGVGTYFIIWFFNTHRIGAQEMLTDHPPFGDRTGVIHRDENKNPRIIIVGLGKFGQNVLVEIAVRWQLWNPEAANKLRVVVIDREVKGRIGKLERLYPFLKDLCEVEVIEVDVESTEYQEAEFLYDEKSRQLDITRIFICFDDDVTGLSAALTLLDKMKDEKQAVPIVIRSRQDKGITSLIKGAQQGSRKTEGKEMYQFIHPFELFSRASKPELLIGFDEKLARTFHEKYAEYMKEKRVQVDGWDEQSETMKLSNRRQAMGMRTVLAMAGFKYVSCNGTDDASFSFTDDEINRIAEFEHQRWVADLMRDGWIFGEEKDKERKIHPDLVPWDKLTEESREIDRQWVRRLPAVLAGFECKICRLQGDETGSD